MVAKRNNEDTLAKEKRGNKKPKVEIEEDIESFDEAELDDSSSEASIEEQSDASQPETESEPEQETGPKSKESILSTTIQRLLQKQPASNPILAQNRVEKRIDDKKLENKARKLISDAKKKKEVEDRVRDPNMGDAKKIEHEKKLRKLATRGVVQLFNAIRAAQKSAEQVTKDTVQKHATTVPVVTKNTFMGMLQRVKDDQKSKDEEKVAETNMTKSSEPAVDWLKSDFPTAKAAKHWDESDSE